MDPDYEVDPTRTDDSETVYAPLVPPWKSDKPPTIDDRFFRSVVPVQMTPSDRISFYTHNLVVGAPPIQIVNRQPEGIACRVRLTNLAANQNDAALLSDPSSLGIVKSAGATAISYVDNGWTLPGGFTGTTNPPLVIETKQELWLVALANAPTIAVMLETYELW